MSFKREGDDSSQLNILKKRRVADLLSNFIPEDEAALIKNGRYTCLVCSYRPVFDTVDMLTVHRKGKKHLEGLKWFYGKKKNLQNEVEKRRHQDYVQAEEHSQGTTSSAPLLSQTRRITHHALLKSIPYNSCHKTTSTKSEKGSASFGPDCNTNHPSNPPSLWYQMPPVEAVGGSDEETKSTSRNCNMAVHHRGKSSEKEKEVPQPPVSSGPQSMTVQRRRELEHYLKLKSSGWVQDNGGNWIKDENVEFDSDEDQPAPLSPSCELPGVLDQEKL